MGIPQEELEAILIEWDIDPFECSREEWRAAVREWHERESRIWMSLVRRIMAA
jgi:hypothetical protein